MAKTTSYRCGVKDLYVAYATQAAGGAVTYGTPEVLGGTASVSVTYESGENKVYESDRLIRSTKRVSGATVNFESRSMSLDAKMRLIDSTITSSTSAAEFEENPDHIAPYLAVGWAAPLTDGGYLCTWMYWATASLGDETYESADTTEKTPTDRVVFSCAPNPETGNIRRVKKCASKAECDAFFASVLPANA